MRIVFVILFAFVCSGLFAQVSSSDSLIKSTVKLESEFIFDATKHKIVEGTKVKMQAPDYFLFSDQIPGFVHPGTSTTIQVQEIVGTSYIMIQQAMTPEHFASQGVVLISTENVTMRDGKTGVLYLVEFESKGITYQRLMLFAGDYNNTIWINANYPKLSSKLLHNLLVQSLLTAQYVQKP